MTAAESAHQRQCGIVTDHDRRTQGGGGRLSAPPNQVWNFNFEVVVDGDVTKKYRVQMEGPYIAGNLRAGDRVCIDTSDLRIDGTSFTRVLYDQNGIPIVTVSSAAGRLSLWLFATRKRRIWFGIVLICALMGIGFGIREANKVALCPPVEWCVGLQQQWQSRRTNENYDDLSIRAEMDTCKCRQLSLPPVDPHVPNTPSPPAPPQSWCLTLKAQWEAEVKTPLGDNAVLRAELKDECKIDLPVPATPAASSPAGPAAVRPPPVRPEKTTPSAWCVALKQQWTFRQKNFHQNDEGIQAELKEECRIVVP